MQRPLITNYTGLVTQQALKAWKKLPPQPRRWIDLADLIQDGLLFAKQQVPKWRPHRSNFATFLTMTLEQYYSRMLHAHFTEKRSKCGLVSIDSVMFRLSEHDPIEEEIHAVEALKKLVSVASPTLRSHIKKWFLTRTYIQYRGENYFAARSEMRVLSKYFGFSRRDMEFLLFNESWRRGVDLRLDR